MGKTNILKTILATTSTNQQVEGELLEELFKECDRSTTYKWLREAWNREKVTIWVKRVKIRSRPNRYVVVKRSDENGSKNIPITQAKLYRKITICSECGNKSCNKSRNLTKLRDSVHDQILEFRRQQLRAGVKMCAISKTRLKPGKIHVDHIKPFSLLVKEWCAGIGFDLCRNKFTEQQLDRWAEHHREVAELQLTNSRANIAKGASYHGS